MHTILDRSKTLFKTKRFLVLSTLAILIFGITRVIVTCYQTYLEKPKIKRIAIAASQILNKDMPVYVQALGTVSAGSHITVKTQVNGQLLRIFFQEGQIVKKGDLLAEIDPRPFEAELRQFQGQLARDHAILDNARLDLQRYEKLYQDNSVSGQTLETQRALVRQYEGIVKLDQGQIDEAMIHLLYCRITSPIDGRVGLRLIDPGNYVQTTDPSGIVILNTIQPISVLFSIAEKFLPSVLQKIRNGDTLIAEAYDKVQNKLLARGNVTSLDNEIDISTGTVKLRGIFPNDNLMLFPNQFVNVKLLVDILKNSMVIPTKAIQQSDKGTFVYLIKKEPNEHVLVKYVNTIMTEEDETVIAGDILPGQFIVTEGADRLVDGSFIQIITGKK